MRRDKLKTGLLGAMLTLLFLSYYSSITLFSHTHIIDGATITHSHAHDSSHHDSQSGGHTKQSITFFALLSHIDFSISQCEFHFAAVEISILNQQSEQAEFINTPVHLQNLSLRAPPCVC